MAERNQTPERKTDLPLKYLRLRLAGHLLPFLGEADARLLDTGVVELPESKRTVDFILKLERDGLLYHHHYEFNAGSPGPLLKRCFEYNSRAHLLLNTPVLTTIIQLFPPGLAGEPIYRVMLGDQEINHWRFEFVNLWEVAVERAFAAAGPGLLALVPLLKGGQVPGAVR